MAFQGPQNGDIRANLAISQDEARLGSSRTINLPGGRAVIVRVPAGINNGEEIRLRGQGDSTSYGGMAGDLILQVSVVAPNRFQGQDADQQTIATQTEQMPLTPFPSVAPTQFSYNQSGAGSIPQEKGNNYYAASDPTEAASNPFSYNQSGAGSIPQEKGNDYYAAFAPTEAASNPFLSGQIPQGYANIGSYPNNQTYPPPPLQPAQHKRSATLTITMIILALALVVGGGLFFYLGYYHPHQIQVAGTATSQTQTALNQSIQANQTANAMASSTAKVNATAQAQATTQANATAQAQATVQAYQTIYTQATSGSPTFSDPMNAQTGRQWDQLSSTAKGTCGFQNGSYHSQMPTVGFFQPCFANNTNLSNFAFQVDMTLVKGTMGGLLLRADSLNNKYYLFRISTDGSYDLFVYVGSQASQAKQILSGQTNLMKPTQTNTITVIAQGPNLYFYINQKYMDHVSNSTYTSGQIGVFGDSTDQATDAAFRNIKVWSL